MPDRPPITPRHLRDPADDWVQLPGGRRVWGLAGAAGLLAWWAEDDAVLLQLRVAWGHHGGTWGLPGGARRFGESAFEGALREAAEEASVPRDAIETIFDHVLDLDVWTYTTIVARATRRFEPIIGDAESDALRWVPIDEMDALELHPSFAAAWPGLLATLRERTA
jgi:8-oxo-dGTP diphosphatase